MARKPSRLRSRSTGWPRILVRLVRFLSRPNTYISILYILVLVLAVGTVLVWILELDAKTPGFLGIDDAFVFMLQNVSGVGIGATPPQTAGARGVGVAFVIIAAGMRAVFIAAVVSSFVNNLLLQGKGLRRVDLEKHVIICGWNPRVKQIVKTLRRDSTERDIPVVLVALINENPLVEYGVKFIKGDPSSAEDLKRAGVSSARAAVIITDESDGQPHTDSTYDARAVLSVLAIKAVNPDLHVVAEVRDPANRPHFQNAHADEIVVSAEVSEGVVARAATNQGIAWVYEDLLRLDSTPEMFVVDLPEGLEGKTFQSALVRLNTRENAILLGVVEGSEVILCPPNDHIIKPETRLVVLSGDSPGHRRDK
ncbi:MAG TPA: NAD-binding protein [Anaerolineae bacterium]